MPQKCILKTSNIMTTSAGAGLQRAGQATRSNTEALAGLRESIRAVDGEGAAKSKVVVDPASGEEVLCIPFNPAPPVGLQEERDEYDVTGEFDLVLINPAREEVGMYRRIPCSGMQEYSGRDSGD